MLSQYHLGGPRTGRLSPPVHTVAIWTFSFHYYSLKNVMIFKTWPWLSNTLKNQFLTNNMKKRWKEGIITISREMFIVHRAHCGKLWVFEVEGQVQVTLEAKLIDILTWNLDFLNPFLFYFLLELRNPLLFVHCGCYNQTLKYPSCGLTQKSWSASRMFQQFGLQKDLNLAFHFFHFSHSQSATVCPVHNKHFTGNGNYTFFSSPNIFFFILLAKNMIF